MSIIVVTQDSTKVVKTATVLQTGIIPEINAGLPSGTRTGIAVALNSATGNFYIFNPTSGKWHQFFVDPAGFV